MHHTGTGGSVPAIYSGMGQCSTGTDGPVMAVPLPSIQVWDSATYWHWWQCPCHLFRYGTMHHTGIGGSAPAIYSGMGQCTILALVAVPLPSIQVWDSATYWHWWQCPCHLFRYGTLHHTGTGGSAPAICSDMHSAPYWHCWQCSYHLFRNRRLHTALVAVLLLSTQV